MGAGLTRGHVALRYKYWVIWSWKCVPKCIQTPIYTMVVVAALDMC